MYTDPLSQKTFAAPSVDTPIIINLYLNETIESAVVHNVTNPVPEFDYQTYSTSWNTRLLVLNYNIKSSPVEIAEFLHLLHDQNRGNN